MKPSKVAQHAVYGAVLLPYIVFGLIRVYRGIVIGDEGWYLLAAANVLEGKVPYADFLFTQMPLVPYFYAAFVLLLGKSLIAVRWVSLCLGGVSIVLAMATCRRRAGLAAAAIAGLLLSLNLSFVYDIVSMKSQALTVFLVTASLYALSKRELSLPGAATALALMNLAVLTRLSILPGLAILWVFVFYTFRQRRGVCLFLAGLNVAAAAGVFAYFYSGGNLIFGIYRFHSEYFAHSSWSSERYWSFLRVLVGNQLPVIVCTFCALAVCLVELRRPSASRHSVFRQHKAFAMMLAASYVVITILHFTRLSPYASHQTSIITFIVILAGMILGEAIKNYSPRYVLPIAFVPFLILAMPFQEYFALGRDGGSPAKSRKAADVIRAVCDPDEKILTLSAELVIMSDRPVLAGYELGQFSYFPNMADARAARLKVINFNRLLDDLHQRKAKMLCLIQRDINMLGRPNPEMFSTAVDTNYRHLAELKGYGQFRQTLHFLVARK